FPTRISGRCKICNTALIEVKVVIAFPPELAASPTHRYLPDSWDAACLIDSGQQIGKGVRCGFNEHNAGSRGHRMGPFNVQRPFLIPAAANRWLHAAGINHLE